MLLFPLYLGGGAGAALLPSVSPVLSLESLAQDGRCASMTWTTLS
jgi:hypothetical protein